MLKKLKYVAVVYSFTEFGKDNVKKGKAVPLFN
jgi:hypothetical protein